jgi:hypothetical protein
MLWGADAMNMRKIYGCLALMLLVAFALPAAADGDKGKKQYSLQMSVPPGQTAAPFTVKAKIKNEGNSSIHSFNLLVGGVTVVGVAKLDDAKVAFTGSSITVTNADDLESGESRTLTITVNSCGDGQWSAAVWTGSKLNGQTFSLMPANSNLTSSIPCGPPLAAGAAFAVPDSLNPGCVTGARGYYDKDGSIPVNSLPIFVTNTVPINGQLHFRWPDFQTGGDPLATFEYTVCGTGALTPLGSVQDAWLNTDGSPASTPGVPAYIPAQVCLYPAVLPVPYGTLLAAVAAGDTTIVVNTSSPSGAHGTIAHPPVPFDIVIGTERMTVTQVLSGDYDNDPSDPNEAAEGEVENGWVVTRAVLDGSTPGAYPAGQIVMSTPLPALPANTGLPYIQPGHPAEGRFVQAQSCIAERTQTPSENPTAHATTFIDIGGDGWSKP